MSSDGHTESDGERSTADATDEQRIVGNIDVLLVEDNHDEARYVERLLHEHAAAVRDADEDRLEIGRFRHVDRLDSALETLGDDAVDVILLDLMLPDSRGVETVGAVAAHAPDLPIVVLTGEDQASVGVRAIQLGAEDYLVKGSLTGQLVYRTIRYAIERKRHQRELVEINHKLALLNRIIRGDIRNEMSIALGWADVLAEGIDLDDSAAFEAMLTAARNVVELTDTAADVATALETDVGIPRESSLLKTVLDDGFEQFRNTHPSVGFAVDYAQSDGHPVTVVATPMLSTAIAELLSNAIALGSDDETAIAVSVDVTSDSALVHIRGERVELSPEQRAFLNESDRHSVEGSGLNTGLYLVKTLIEQLGGTIAVTEDSSGTTISITLERVTTSA